MARLWFYLALCALLQPAAAFPDAMSVVVSILPQKYFVERVGGEHVSVAVLAGPGQSPVSYEPTPRQLAIMSGARLFFRIGVPFEERWMSKFAASSDSLSILDARDGITLREMDAAGPGSSSADNPEHAHEHGSADPHLWLSPPLVKEVVRRLRDRLMLLDPENRESYERNFSRFAADLSVLDGEIREMTRAHQGMRFLVFHPAWGYFADNYGLRQIAVEAGGKAPGPRTLARLVDLAQAHDIRTILVERQFGARTARAVAETIGGNVLVVDPLSEDYLENLRDIARLLTGS